MITEQEFNADFSLNFQKMNRDDFSVWYSEERPDVT